MTCARLYIAVREDGDATAASLPKDVAHEMILVAVMRVENRLSRDRARNALDVPSSSPHGRQALVR